MSFDNAWDRLDNQTCVEKIDYLTCLSLTNYVIIVKAQRCNCLLQVSFCAWMLDAWWISRHVIRRGMVLKEECFCLQLFWMIKLNTFLFTYPMKGPLGAVAWNLDSTIVVSPLVSLTSRLKTCWELSAIASCRTTSAL